MIIAFAASVFTILSVVPLALPGLKKIDFLSELRPKKSHKPTGVPTVEKSGVAVVDTVKVKPDLPQSATAAGDLGVLFKALKTRKSGKSVRIAYFGDSMIEGDLVTNDLRKMLQHIFGGNGVGFVPITSVSASFRPSIRHTYNNNWKSFNFSNAKPPKDLYCGPSGYIFESTAGAKVSYAASKEYAPFRTVRLYYGNVDSASILVKEDSATYTKELEPASIVNEVVLNDSQVIRNIDIEVKSVKPASFYGCSFENGDGLYLDNYSFRGNSGIPLSTIPQSVYKGFDERMNYKLIILHYGLNVVAHDVQDYSWYERSFRKTLQHVKASFPNSAILLISVNDKSYRTDGVWETEPDIPRFVAIQQKLAEEAGIAFWNLYEAMGGYNSMKGWAESKPALANADYTHPNHRGAAKIANLLYDHLMTGYNQFLKQESVLLTVNKDSVQVK